MPNIFFELFIESADFSGKDLKIKKSSAYSSQYNTLSITDNDIENLYSKILRAKGDWASLNFYNFNNNFYIEISLIFNAGYQSVEHENIINKVLKICDDFVNASKVGEVNIYYNNLSKLEEIAFDECYVLSLSEGGGGVIDFDVVKQVLNEKHLDYNVVTEKISRFDGGASGSSEEFIAFLSATVASGLTWDMVKMALAYKLGIDIDRIIITCLNKAKFKILRRDIADKIRERSKDLYLKRFEEKNSKLILVFGCKGTEIEVVCDKEYRIKSLKIG
ncbi:hypothetical protein [Ruminiclostridium cellobioparum]|uniref:Uncharacterized protein n=1 Tax=Ruminiclostridium cellobioparum subsp. termitidis CT1112 TaxID=1195236 RepID=S0FQD6_RUMCE|nr:hypothetical protein [Ruminiclostridium cellobioparum]EMS72581.1 hypothetical protein CTER_1478 [Ruminiclostridium cellobioparum subsp. termitidis CT1112]